MATQSKTTQADKAKELLSSLTATKKPAPKAAARSKPKIAMTPEIEQPFVRFVEAYALAKDVDSRRDTEKGLLNSACTENWIEQLWKTKVRPSTQTLETTSDGKPEHSANFIVAERYTFNTPERKDDETLEEVFTRKFTELFVATGMSAVEAETSAVNFVNNEMDLKPRPSIDLFRWLEGHYEGQGDYKIFVEATDEERAIGIKIVQALQARNTKQFTPLSQEEYDKVVETKEYIGVKKGFLQRATSYVCSVEQLKAIFMVIKPVVWPGQIEFARSATPQERNQKKLNVCVDVLGVSN